ncbi:uncharacterized protein LOC117319683 isoform X1 [Pecten maximus]|uniref:uncharacterized protein LOC117319683 isoform X1 n=1 Tax=Pecten maximus TaxID=6579 RepID=UPI0014584516|nr:uncharacterized protein LOC117319683 isoform X1 [Pecten maximus]
MVVLSKATLFSMLEEQWKEPLTLDVVKKFKTKLENDLSLSFKTNDKDLYILRAELYRLKTNGLRAKVKGGNQFSRYKHSISHSKFSWDVSLALHETEIRVEEMKNKLMKCVEEKTIIEGKFCDFVTNTKKKEQKFVEKISSLENELNKPLNGDKQCKNNYENVCSTRKRKSMQECSSSYQMKMKKKDNEKCKNALENLELNGCKPVSVTVLRNGREEVIKLFQADEDDIENVDETKLDSINALLYILDTFNVSQEAYHELSSLFKSMPRAHNIAEYIRSLNKDFKIINTPDGLGVQQSLKQRLVDVVSQLLLENSDLIPDNNLKVKISGDGTRVGKRLHVVNFAFNIVNEGSAHQICYPLCIIQTKEKYAELNIALNDLQQDVAEFQGSKLKVGDREFTVNIYLGGDYKFLLVAVGISSVAATHSCIYCKCEKKERINLAKRWSMKDPVLGARLSYISSEPMDIPATGRSSKRKKVQTYSIVNQPLFPCITPFQVVLDQLHLFLRITDKLFNLLVSELRVLDNISQQATFVELDRTKIKHVAALENVLQQMGIPFELFVNKDTRKLEYRDLMGPEKLKLMEKFKASDLLPDRERADQIQKLWDDFSEINVLLRSESPIPEDFQVKAESWCNMYVSLYQCRDITPYIHTLRYHVSELFQLHGNLVRFSQQGLEKMNDIITESYLRATNHRGHSALKQVMEKQNRLVLLARHKRKKRVYKDRKQ